MADEKLTPPSADRVAARALVMVAVSCRGFIEQDAEQAASFWKRVLEWFMALGISAEMEPWERQAIQTPLGSLDSQTHANAQWMCEGLAVLAWSLGRWDMLRHDQQVVAARVSESLGFLAERGQTVLARPQLRTPEQIEKFRSEAFTVHWRLVDFSLNRRAMNLREFLKTAWFGPLELSAAALIKDDLCVGASPIASAPADQVRLTASIALERHKAANWLCGESDVYSETDVST